MKKILILSILSGFWTIGAQATSPKGDCFVNVRIVQKQEFVGTEFRTSRVGLQSVPSMVPVYKSFYYLEGVKKISDQLKYEYFGPYEATVSNRETLSNRIADFKLARAADFCK